MTTAIGRQTGHTCVAAIRGHTLIEHADRVELACERLCKRLQAYALT